MGKENRHEKSLVPYTGGERTASNLASRPGEEVHDDVAVASGTEDVKR